MFCRASVSAQPRRFTERLRNELAGPRDMSRSYVAFNTNAYNSRMNMLSDITALLCMQDGTKQNPALGFVRGGSISRLHLGDFSFARD